MEEFPIADFRFQIYRQKFWIPDQVGNDKQRSQNEVASI